MLAKGDFSKFPVRLIVYRFFRSKCHRSKSMCFGVSELLVTLGSILIVLSLQFFTQF